MLKTHHTKKGFTLIELLLYVAIASALLVSVSIFIYGILNSRVRNQVISEVEGQGVQAMELIVQAVRNSTGITSPTPGASSPSLFLGDYTPSMNPVVFDLNTGALYMKEGGPAAVAITNSKVTASGLDFTNLSRTGTPGIVRIEFTLTYNNPTGREEFSYSKTFRSSASVRQP